MDRDERTAARASANRLDSRLRVYRGVALLGLATLLAAALAAWLPGLRQPQQPERSRAVPSTAAPSSGCRSGRSQGPAGAEPRTAEGSYAARRSRRGRLSASPALRLKYSARQAVEAGAGGNGAGVSAHADLDRLEQKDYETNLDGVFW